MGGTDIIGIALNSKLNIKRCRWQEKQITSVQSGDLWSHVLFEIKLYRLVQSESAIIVGDRDT